MSAAKPFATATPAELKLLALVLREVRHVRATGEQLSIIVDPHTSPRLSGANVCFSYNGRGWSTEVGALRSKHSRRGRTR